MIAREAEEVQPGSDDSGTDGFRLAQCSPKFTTRLCSSQGFATFACTSIPRIVLFVYLSICSSKDSVVSQGMTAPQNNTNTYISSVYTEVIPQNTKLVHKYCIRCNKYNTQYNTIPYTTTSEVQIIVPWQVGLFLRGRGGGGGVVNTFLTDGWKLIACRKFQVNSDSNQEGLPTYVKYFPIL